MLDGGIEQLTDLPPGEVGVVIAGPRVGRAVEGTQLRSCRPTWSMFL
jgi:hypothetical protein